VQKFVHDFQTKPDFVDRSQSGFDVARFEEVSIGLGQEDQNKKTDIAFANYRSQSMDFKIDKNESDRQSLLTQRMPRFTS
jgi:hypothetical protein